MMWWENEDPLATLVVLIIIVLAVVGWAYLGG